MPPQFVKQKCVQSSHPVMPDALSPLVPEVFTLHLQKKMLQAHDGGIRVPAWGKCEFQHGWNPSCSTGGIQVAAWEESVFQHGQNPSSSMGEGIQVSALTESKFQHLWNQSSSMGGI